MPSRYFTEAKPLVTIKEPTEPELRRLVARGKRRGYVTYAEVAAALPPSSSLADRAECWLEELCRSHVELVDDSDGTGAAAGRGSGSHPASNRRLPVPVGGDPSVAADTGDPLRMYFRSIGSVPLLTREGEVEICQRIESGEQRMIAAIDRRNTVTRRRGRRRAPSSRGQAAELRAANVELEAGRREVTKAKGEMVEANLRLVIAAAKKYAHHGVGLLDLIQEGNIGLMKATDRFQYRRGYKFSTYATWWVRQSITRAIADQSRTIRLPVHVGERVAKLGRARLFLVKSLGREPTVEELGAELDKTAAQVRMTLQSARPTVSLEMPVGEEGDASLSDFLPDKGAASPLDAASMQDLGDKTRELLRTLSPIEEQILRLRFGIGGGSSHTLEEVGQQFRLTRERIRQIEAKALGKLRKRCRGEPFEALLDS